MEQQDEESPTPGSAATANNGVVMDRLVSNAREWMGRYREAEEAIRTIAGVWTVVVKPGTRGRPVDSITITADPGRNRKRLVDDVEVLLRNLLGLIIDYRVVSIH